MALAASDLLDVARGRKSVSWPRGADRVWLLTAVLAASALLLYGLAQAIGIRPLTAPVHLEWWMLALPFAAVEIFVVHLPFRRETVSFSLSEIPLIIGLFFADPLHLLAAQMVGTGLALVLHRRQPLIKLCFNLANLAFSTSVAVLLFNLIMGHTSDPLGPLGWLATFGAAMAVELLGLATIMMAITLAVGRPPELVRLVSSGVVTTFFNTTLALITIMLAWSRLETVWLPTALAALLFLAYQAHGNIRRKQEALEVLYDSTRQMQESISAGNAIETILAQARKMFHADRAELLLLAEDGGLPLLSSLGAPKCDGQGVDGAGELRLMKPVELAPNAGVWARVISEEESVLLAAPIANLRLRDHFAARGIKDAMVVPIRGEAGILGTLLVGNRLGDVGTFSAEDLRFFETFANHASISLQNNHLVDQLRQAAADMEYEALHDSLTGLANRTLLRTHMEQLISGRRGTDGQFALLLMDLDRFKDVNDTIGHYNGDLLLVEFAKRLSGALGSGTTIARLGGDEFAALLPDVGTPERAAGIARLVLEALEKPFMMAGLTLEVAASIGIALYPDQGPDVDTLIQRADVAMYSAKESHSGFEFYSVEHDQYSVEKLALIGELRRAIDEGELVMYYQPKVDIATGRIKGAESLVRWNHPKRGLVFPDEFIPTAERTGLLRPLTLLSLRDSIRQCAEWRAQGFEVTMAVNLSVRNLLDADLPDDITRILGSYNLPPSLLVLEVTEGTVMADPVRTIAALDKLHRIGVALSIDDFGTGYSSLSYIKKLPVDEIKIDKSFVMHMANDEDDQVIVRSTIELGHNLGLRVVAEGVETQEAWDKLREMGCDIGQGYLFAKAIPVAAFTAKLLEGGPRHGQPEGKPEADDCRGSECRAARGQVQGPASEDRSLKNGPRG